MSLLETKSLNDLTIDDCGKIVENVDQETDLNSPYENTEALVFTELVCNLAEEKVAEEDKTYIGE